MPQGFFGSAPTASAVMREVRELQASFLDKASSYTKIIFGLAYGGFFAAWSGTRQHLSPRVTIWSILLMLVSVVLFLLFEVAQTMITSFLAIRFSRAVDAGGDLQQSMEKFRETSAKCTKPLYAAWFAVFPMCVATGLCGTGVLLYGFVRALLG